MKTKAKTKTKTKAKRKMKTKTKMKNKRKTKTKMKLKMNFRFYFHFYFHIRFSFLFLLFLSKSFCIFVNSAWPRGAIGGQLSLDWPRSAIAFLLTPRSLEVPQMVSSLLLGLEVPQHFRLRIFHVVKRCHRLSTLS